MFILDCFKRTVKLFKNNQNPVDVPRVPTSMCIMLEIYHFSNLVNLYYIILTTLLTAKYLADKVEIRSKGVFKEILCKKWNIHCIK